MHRTSEDVHNAKFAVASEWDAADDKAKIAIQVSRGEAAVSRQVLAINAQFEGQWIRAYSKSTYDGPEDDDLKMEEFAREKAFNLALGALYLGHFDDGTRYKVEFTSEAVRSDPLLFAFQSAPTRDIKIRCYYDRKYAVESWGEDVAPYFADAFRNRARHCLVLWSKEYSVKQWPPL